MSHVRFVHPITKWCTEAKRFWFCPNFSNGNVPKTPWTLGWFGLSRPFSATRPLLKTFTSYYFWNDVLTFPLTISDKKKMRRYNLHLFILLISSLLKSRQKNYSIHECKIFTRGYLRVQVPGLSEIPDVDIASHNVKSHEKGVRNPYLA